MKILTKEPFVPSEVPITKLFWDKESNRLENWDDTLIFNSWEHFKQYIESNPNEFIVIEIDQCDRHDTFLFFGQEWIPPDDRRIDFIDENLMGFFCILPQD